MALAYSPHTRIDLKKSDVTENLMQDRIVANPAILGLGDEVQHQVLAGRGHAL